MIRPVLLSCDEGQARISLVPEGALLLAGDDVGLRFDVGPGATVHVYEPAGTVAYDMRGGSARWQVDVVLGIGAALIWHGEPFVAAAGSVTAWVMRVAVDYGSRFALREILVLGRHGESPGRVTHEVYVNHVDGRPILADGVELGPGRTEIALGGRRAMGTVLLVGAELPASTANTATRFDLDADGVLVRALSGEAHRVVDPDLWESAVAAVSASGAATVSRPPRSAP